MVEKGSCVGCKSGEFEREGCEWTGGEAAWVMCRGFWAREFGWDAVAKSPRPFKHWRLSAWIGCRGERMMCQRSDFLLVVFCWCQ